MATDWHRKRKTNFTQRHRGHQENEIQKIKQKIMSFTLCVFVTSCEELSFLGLRLEMTNLSTSNFSFILCGFEMPFEENRYLSLECNFFTGAWVFEC